MGSPVACVIRVSICRANGWTERNRPKCSWCANPIGVRGDVPENAVLVGEILLTVVDGKVTRIAHFDCERHMWRLAEKTGVWNERAVDGRTLLLVSSRPEWASKQPWYVDA